MIPLDSLGYDDYFSRPRSGPCHPQGQLGLWWLHRQKNRCHRAARGKGSSHTAVTHDTYLSRVCRRASRTITRGRWTSLLTDSEIFRREAAVCTICTICSDVAIKLKQAQSSAHQKRRCGCDGRNGRDGRHGPFQSPAQASTS